MVWLPEGKALWSEETAVQRPGAGLSLTSLMINHGIHVCGSDLGDMEERTQ